MQIGARGGWPTSIATGDRVAVKLAPPDYARGVITWRLDD